MAKYYGSVLSVLLWVSLGTSTAHAQVTPDGTLSTTVTSSDHLNFTIENGDRAGNNLFHSFEEFSVPTGGSAIFNNATNIEAIFSRVTGTSISDIDGLIQPNGSANLFLLNPNGIIFGPNASLNIGGSFLTTTADSIVFQDDSLFSVANPNTSPLLTVSVPVGIQFGTRAQPITYNAPLAASSLRLYDPSTYNITNGLQVNPGQAITLLGGDILMEGGVLIAPNGRIELGSVTPGSFVGFDANSQTLNYSRIGNFQDIHLSQGTLVSTSGAGGGNIQLQGRVVSVTDAAKIAANTIGAEDGGTLHVRATERLDVTGLGSQSVLTGIFNADSPDETVTGLFSSTLEGSSGRGSDLIVDTPQLRVSEAGLIWAEVSGSGAGGDLEIRANQLDLIGNPEGASNGGYSQISTGSYETGTGPGGNLTIEADHFFAQHWSLAASVRKGSGNGGQFTLNVGRLQVLDGAQMGGGSLGNSNGTEVTINASESVEISGGSRFVLGEFSSGIFASAEPGSSGNASDIRVTTPVLRLINGGKIAANTVESGSGGNITVRADLIEVAEPLVDFTGTVSGIVTTASTRASNRSGNITLETNELRVFNGGQIISATDSTGNAGNITIRANTVDVTGSSADWAGNSSDTIFLSGINARSSTDFRAGTVDITADRLSVRNGAEIAVGNLGTGDAGNLNISANQIFLNNGGSLQAEVNGGSQGNINVGGRDVLLLKNSSIISANATGASTGGNINIEAGFIVGVDEDNSESSANYEASFVGRVTLTASGVCGLEFRPQLTSLSDITASSGLGGDFSGVVEITTPDADPGSDVAELPSTLADANDRITASCGDVGENTFIATGRGGIAANPTGLMDVDRPWSDTRDLSAFLENESDTPVSISDAQPTNIEPIQEATGMAIAQDGTVQFVAATYAQNALVPHASCTSQSHIR